MLDWCNDASRREAVNPLKILHDGAGCCQEHDAPHEG